jgi:hypothetical protein
LAQAIAGAASCAIIAGFVTVAASSASAAPQSRSRVVIVNCVGKAQVKPSQFVLTCADYGDYLTGMHWVSWKNVAFGIGTEHIENCYPSCASTTNKFYTYSVLLTLWRARSAHGGSRYFSRLTEIRTGSLKLPHDPNLSRTQTWGLGASGG